MKIVIITDSLGLPRNTPEFLSLEETYPDMLRQSFKTGKIITLSIGGATIDTLYDQFFSYFSSINPDLVVVHAGIVDCAPRALKKWEIKILSSNSLLKKASSIFIKKYTFSLRKTRNITYTPLARFEKIAEDFSKRLQNKVHWIGIAPACSLYEEQVPNISSNIEKYNQSLQRIFGCNFIEMSDLESSSLMSDFHHLNKEGHKKVYDKLKKLIADLI